VELVSEKSYNTAHYLEVLIEEWLGIKDIKVAGKYEPSP
jgi:hypothetical protein